MIRPILSLRRLSLDEAQRQVVYQYGKHSGETEYMDYLEFIARVIKKVYEIDPLICPKCGGLMKVISFIEDYKVIDKIIDHLKLTFKAERPPPPAQAQLSVAAEERLEYIWKLRVIDNQFRAKSIQ